MYYISSLKYILKKLKTDLKVEVWQQRPEKKRQCTLIGCTQVWPVTVNCQMNPYCRRVVSLNIQRCSSYLSGGVYDMMESGGGRGSKPIRGWLVTSCRHRMAANLQKCRCL